VGESDALAGTGRGVFGELALVTFRPRLDPLAGVPIRHPVLAAAGEHGALSEAGLPSVEGALIEPGDAGDMRSELDPAGQSGQHVHGFAHLAQGTAADQLQSAVAVPHSHGHALLQRLDTGGVETVVDGEVTVGEEELLPVDDLGTQPVGPAHPVHAVQALDRAAQRALQARVQGVGHRLVIRQQDRVEQAHATASR
jgi:hypothetical protein